ncbi:MAG: D-aminoacyl-tRNA deacylase, partial [bacterium]|nr:D-aminoacyl-tRNA deacylase [bacterium]
MKAVIQRVHKASVEVKGKITAAISEGMLVFAGIEKNDSESDISYISDKLDRFRIFNDKFGKMNLYVADIGGSVLVVY